MTLSTIITNEDALDDFLDDDEQIDSVHRLLDEEGLPEEAFAIFAPLQNLVALNKLDPMDLPKRFEERLKMAPDQALALAKRVVVKLLAPLREIRPVVATAIETWNLDPKMEASVSVSLPEQKKEVHRLSANAFVHHEVEKYKLQLPETANQRRFEELLSEFVVGKRTKQEVLELLSRERKIGGLGLDLRASEQLLDGLMEDAEEVKEHPEEEEAIEAEERIPKPLPPRKVVHPLEELLSEAVGEPVSLEAFAEKAPSFSPSRPIFDATTIHPKDAQEVEAHKTRLPIVLPLHDVDTAVKEVMEAITLPLTEEIKKQLTSVVRTRLSGIRDPYATRDALEKPVEEGGVGLSGAELATVLEAIEKTYGHLDASARSQKNSERQSYVDARVARHFSSEESTSLPETPVAPRSPASVASSPMPELKPLPRQTPRMRDVTPTRRLSGPIEEIAQMGLAEFRRLGDTPEEASTELLERLALLEEESYGKRLEGISAWRRSPVYVMYVGLVNEAMKTGQPIETIVNAHATAKDGMMNAQELQAILSLNRKLKS